MFLQQFIPTWYLYTTKSYYSILRRFWYYLYTIVLSTWKILLSFCNRAFSVSNFFKISMFMFITVLYYFEYIRRVYKTTTLKYFRSATEYTTVSTPELQMKKYFEILKHCYLIYFFEVPIRVVWQIPAKKYITTSTTLLLVHHFEVV